MPPTVNTCPPGTSARHAVEQRLALVGLRVHDAHDDELERRSAEVVIAPVGDDALKLRAAGRALSGPFERQWQPGRLSLRVRPRRERAAPRRGVGTSPPRREGAISPWRRFFRHAWSRERGPGFNAW